MQTSVNVEYLCLIQLELQTDLVLTSIDKREITTRETKILTLVQPQAFVSMSFLLTKKLEYKEA